MRGDRTCGCDHCDCSCDRCEVPPTEAEKHESFLRSIRYIGSSCDRMFKRMAEDYDERSWLGPRILHEGLPFGVEADINFTTPVKIEWWQDDGHLRISIRTVDRSLPEPILYCTIALDTHFQDVVDPLVWADIVKLKYTQAIMQLAEYRDRQEALT